MGDFNQPTKIEYKINKDGNGVYVFLIEGSAEIAGEAIKKRDALGIWEADKFNLKMASNSRVLLIEVPVNL